MPSLRTHASNRIHWERLRLTAGSVQRCFTLTYSNDLSRYAVIDEFIGDCLPDSHKSLNLPISYQHYEIGQCPPHWRNVLRRRNQYRRESF